MGKFEGDLVVEEILIREGEPDEVEEEADID